MTIRQATAEIVEIRSVERVPGVTPGGYFKRRLLSLIENS